MTSEACREYRAALGAVALGTADPGEELALQAHLDGCAACRTELRELTSVAAALPLADPTHVMGDLPQPPTELGHQVLGRLASERAAHRRRLRRRIAVAAATATAIAAAIVALVLVVPSSNSPAGTHVVFASRPGVSAVATLRSHDAGTEVAFHVSGLQAGDYYWLWLTGSDEHRIAAGTFQGTTKPADLVMSAAIPLSEARRIWVTDAHDHVVLDYHLPVATT
jgi:hypothetical protein